MSAQESSVSMSNLDKKSGDDLAERLSMDEPDENGILPGDSHVRGSGMIGTVANLVNTIIGSGVLALPSACAKTGWLLCVVLMVISAVLTLWALHYLSQCAHRMGGDKTSFGNVAAKTYPWMIIVVDFFVFATVFGICVAYMTIAGSILPMVVQLFNPGMYKSDPDNILFQFWFWVLIAWAVFAAPLSMLKSVKILGYTSAIAVLCVLYTTVVVCMYAFGLLDPCAKTLKEGQACVGNIIAVNAKFTDVFMAVPIFFTAFCCAPSLFNIYNDLKRPSVKRMDVGCGLTMAICSGLYIIIALCGYFTYGDAVAGNILDSFPVEIWATIARIGTAFVVTVSYPLLMHPARDSLIHIINVLMGGKLSDTRSKQFQIAFYSIAGILNVIAFALALLQVPLDFILGITGSIGVCQLSFTIPAIFYFKMFDDKPGFKRMLTIPLFIFGIAATVISFYCNMLPYF